MCNILIDARLYALSSEEAFLLKFRLHMAVPTRFGLDSMLHNSIRCMELDGVSRRLTLWCSRRLFSAASSRKKAIRWFLDIERMDKKTA